MSLAIKNRSLQTAKRDSRCAASVQGESAGYLASDRQWNLRAALIERRAPSEYTNVIALKPKMDILSRNCDAMAEFNPLRVRLIWPRTCS